MELTSDTEIEPLLRELLASQIGQKRFDLWFSSDVRFLLRDDGMTVSAPNEFLSGWLRGNYRHIISELCREVLGREVPVDFVSEESTASTQEVLEVVTDPTSIHSEKIGGAGKPKARKPNAAGSVEHTMGAEAVPRGGVGLPKSRSPRDERPALRKRNERTPGRVFASYESFVVGISNQSAKRITDIAIDSPGTLSPILVYGPTSVGKTHLLEGVYSEFRKNSGRKRPRYLTADEFTGQFVQGFQEKPGGDRSFRARFRDVNLLVIEDIQNLEKKIATQRELSRLIDELRAKGVQMIFSADRPLADLNFLRPELLTRLESGIVCGIETPDRDTLLQIFRRMAEERGLKIPDDVCRFVISRFTTHARQLSGALNRLHVAYLTDGVPFTVESASEILADLLPCRQVLVTLDEIEQTVSSLFGVPSKELRGRSRSRQCSHPRMLAMWLARKYTRSALSEIGRHFGGRSHSTVAAAQKKVETWLRQGENPEFSDALRRAEQLLSFRRH
ncbi:MAG: DnaA ATPase domain-containing protein [Thermoguttaceae bacterium]|jgi:chromosomal replication initiator protein